MSRVSKFLTAGVAVAGAAAIAATPVSPVLEDVKIAASAEAHAVALTAAADPLVVFQRFIAETLLNSGYLGSNATNAYAAVASAFVNADLFGEFSDIVSGNLSNPTPLLTRLSQFGEVYGDDLQIAFFGRDDDPDTTVNESYAGVFDRYQLAGAEFQALLADLQNYDPPRDAAGNPLEGQLTNAAFEINSFFVFGVLDNLRPLIGATPAGIVPLFSIPGDFLGGEVAGGFEGALPGFDRLDNLINVLNEQTFVRAAVGPFQTAFFQVAQVLDDALAAYEDGDTELALNELTNLPVRTVNAFVNGFAPVFSPGGEEWPSLLDPRQQQAGLFKYLAVDLPNQLITALGGTPYVPQVPPAPTTAPTGNAILAAESSEVVTKEIEVPAGASADDTVKLVNDSTVVDTPAAETDDLEETKEATKATPGKLSYKPGDGLKALKKAGDDFNKSVKNLFTPKKKDSDKGAVGDTDTSNTGGTAGGTTGGSTGGEAGGETGGGDADK
jgi:hypothetical protein